MLPLVDKNCKIVPIYAYGVNTISSGINEVDMTNVGYLFGKLWTENINNSYGEVDVLIGINYASIQSQVEQTIGNHVLCKNRFGRCVAGSHELLKGQGSPSIHLCILKNKKPLLENRFSIEQMGVNCTPKCGNCRCGRCPIGGKEFTIKEERELKMIED